MPTLTYVRVATRSETNLARLRIWLSHYAFKSFEYPQRGVRRFGPGTVVKYGNNIREAEAASMEYISRNTTIPVPRVHDVFVIRKMTFIVMDYVPGVEASTYLCGASKASKDQKADVVSQLKGYIAQMRTLTPLHPGRVEAVDGTALWDYRVAQNRKGFFGPDPSITAFHVRLGHTCLGGEEHRSVWPLIERIAKRDLRTVFTHCDLASRNVIVKDGSIAAILDWTMSGWYPEYWEYTVWQTSNHDSLWHDSRDEVLDPYPEELQLENYLTTIFTRV